MKTIYMYQLEDSKCFTSEDEPTQMDKLCCDEGHLHIFRICFDAEICSIEEFICDEENSYEKWIKLNGSEIRQQRYNAVDNPFHFPIGGIK